MKDFWPRARLDDARSFACASEAIFKRGNLARFGGVAIVFGVLLLVLPLGCAREQSDPEDSPPGSMPSYALAADWTSKEISALIAGAVEDLRAGRAQEALDSLKLAASQPIVDPRISVLYGRALFDTGNPALAVWPLARAAENAAPASDPAFLYARALLAGGDSITAIHELDRLLEQAPQETRLVRLRATAHQRSLEFEKALADLETLIEMEPNDLSAIEARIGLLMELERVDEARGTVAALNERVATLNLPEVERARFCSFGALFEFQNEANERARAMFEACLAAFPDEPNVIFPWTVFLDGTGEPEKAIAVLEQTIAGGGSGLVGYRVGLADRYERAGRRDDVERVLIEAAEEFEDPGLLFLVADRRVEWGDLEGAKQIANRAIEERFGHAPGSPDFAWSELPAEGRFAFGDLLIRTGQEAEVLDLIGSFDTSREGDEEVYPILLRARLRLEQDDPKGALELFEESFRFWPSNVGARYLAGRAAMELGSFDLGMSFYRDAFRAEPTGSNAGLVLARLHAAEGNALAAADTLGTLLSQNREDTEALLLFSQMASRVGAFEGSETTRKDLARFREWQGAVYREAALEIVRREDLPTAIAHLEEVADFADPVQYEALSQWVRFQHESGRLDSALDRVRDLRAEGTPAAELDVVWARAERLAEASGEAVAAYREAVSRDPLFVTAWVELGETLLAAGDLESARSAFDSALAIETSELRASIGLADVALAAGQPDEAKALYRKTLVAHPWQGRAASALARIDFDRGETGEQTVIWARWAARFDEMDRAAAAERLGEIRRARGEPREAAIAFQIAIAQSAAPSRPLFLLGRLLSEIGESAQAIEALERALELGGVKDPEEADETRRLLNKLREGA